MQLGCLDTEGLVSIRGQSPGNLTLVHFQATLGHVAHTTLRLLGTEHGKIVQERSLRRDLKIPDGAVSLWVVRTRESVPAFVLTESLATSLPTSRPS